MTVFQLLDTHGVSVSDAKNFIFSYIDSNPSLIYNTCKSIGMSNDMLSDLLADDFPGLTASVVSDFFTSLGFDGSALSASTTSTIDTSNFSKYSAVIMYENVSKSIVDAMSTSYANMTYADASTWNGINDLSIPFDSYTDYGAYEVGYANGYTTTAIGVDMKEYDATLSGVLSAYGVDGSTMASSTGNYDLIIGI